MDCLDQLDNKDHPSLLRLEKKANEDTAYVASAVRLYHIATNGTR